MNLTDFEQTPVARVFEAVRKEAARYGAAPVSSEIVGLIPKKALENAAEWFLQIENFDAALILENRLAAVMSGKPAAGSVRAGVEPFLERLAAPTGTPGGGSASAAAAAMAAGLCSMVAGMSRGKRNYLAYERELGEALTRLAALREQLQAAIDADAAAYDAVVKACKRAKTVPNGEAAIAEALKGATRIPLEVVERAREVREWAMRLGPITNPKMASDLTVATALANAAMQGAAANVEINLESLAEGDFKREAGLRLTGLRK
jgi:formiminotetrahydrofolate cyclodeaminase